MVVLVMFDIGHSVWGKSNLFLKVLLVFILKTCFHLFIRREQLMTGRSMAIHSEIGSAQWFFDRATAPILAVHHQRVRDLLPYAGSPKWKREREALTALWRENTKDARELLDVTEAEIAEHGEISQATDAAWDEVTTRYAAMTSKAAIMAAFDQALGALRAA